MSHAAATHPDRRVSGERLRRLAVYASMAVALSLVAIKGGAWLASGSVSLLASLFDSLLDTLASSIALIGVVQAQKPPDQQHRYGHGKAEGIAALVQAGLILLSAVLILIEAGKHLIDPQRIAATGLGIGVMIAAILLTLALVGFQRWVIRRTGSVAVEADHLHYIGDLLSNLAVIAALLIVSATGWAWVDAVFGIGIALVLAHGARAVIGRALNLLMDRELEAEDRDRILAIALGHPSVLGTHDLRTRDSGGAIFIELHIELDPQMRLERVHDVSDEVVALIQRRFPKAQVTLHPDPVGIDEPRLDDTLDIAADAAEDAA